MTTRPILFSGPMVRAILEAKKTQTRRIVKPQPPQGASCPSLMTTGRWLFLEFGQGWRCPYGQPGDRLWVRETWRSVWVQEPILQYRADGSFREPINHFEHNQFAGELKSMPDRHSDGMIDDRRWRPSIHMPRWASRLTLEIVKVRVERLQDISAFDALTEGCPYHHATGFSPSDAINWYHELWNSINGEGSWEANPWVWVVEFTRVSNDQAHGAAGVGNQPQTHRIYGYKNSIENR